MTCDRASIINELRIAREKINWLVESERRRLFRKLEPLFELPRSRLPDLRDIFHGEEIERLLADSIDYSGADLNNHRAERFIRLVVRTRYKNQPYLDGEGRPVLGRTTALHLAARSESSLCVVDDLFKIYDGLEANYRDEFGTTHFHVACMSGCDKIVARFLDLGEDPNGLGRESIVGIVDRPLHLALKHGHWQVAELLLKKGANSNLINVYGLTPLLVICNRDDDDDDDYDELMKTFFDINDALHRTVRVDVGDKSGNTPLHLAIKSGHPRSIELLLRRGADPQACNEDGSTPLHAICRRDSDDDSVQAFFDVNNEMNQMVNVDARDDRGRTPLQWAVASLASKSLDTLLRYGADLEGFVFPSQSHLDECFEAWRYESSDRCQLRLLAGAMAVVECLEKRGYALRRSDALKLMKLLEKYGWLDSKPDHLDELWYEDEMFARAAKRILASENDPDLTIYDLARLPAEETTDLIVRTDVLEFAGKSRRLFWEQPVWPSPACALRLCDKMSRGFFRRWALDSLLELTSYELPIEYCEAVIERLRARDLCSLFLADAAKD